MTTDRQAAFISDLVLARWQGLGEPDAATAIASILGKLDSLDTKGASELISRIKNLPEDPDPCMPPNVAVSPRKGINGRAQTCATCGHTVSPGAGYWYATSAGYPVSHKLGECSDSPAPAPTVVEEGIYLVGDKTIKVYMTKNGRLAGKVYNDVGRFVYATGAVKEASLGRRITTEETK